MSDFDSPSRPDSRASLLRYLDGTLSPEEVVRLNEQLKADTSLRRDFAELLLQEVHLGELGREALAAANATDGGARPTTHSPAEAGVLAFPLLKRGRGESLPAWDRWRRPLALAASLAGLLGLAAWLFPPTHNAPTLSLAPTATVTIERGPERLIARDQMILRPDDVLSIVGTNTATLSYGSEPTQVTFGGGELKILAWNQGKRFELRQGQIEATVARQRPFRPMIFTTRQAEARVLGTRFTLGATTNATRLDVTEGSVRFTRASDDVAVKVGAGNYAVAAANYEIRAQPLTGSILREYWTNLPGEEDIAFLIGHSAFPDHPSGHEYLNKFATPSHWGTNYGARIYGYLHPPATGEYAFWIAAGDAATLSLSPDDDPDNQQGIAFAVPTSPEDWTKDPGQQSLSVPLVAGRKYYLQVLQKQGSTHEDHLAVAWQGPGRQREVIPGEFLSPFKPKPTEKKP